MIVFSHLLGGGGTEPHSGPLQALGFGGGTLGLAGTGVGFLLGVTGTIFLIVLVVVVPLGLTVTC
jgi:hypothetical protein